MSTGPIEFDEEEARFTGYATEMGGVDGLIQPEFVGEPAQDNEQGKGHEILTESEKSGVASRRGMVPLSSREAWTGEPDTEDIIDPVSGRRLDPADYEDVTGTGGTPSDLKP